MACGNSGLTLLLFIMVTVVARSWWTSEPNTGITILHRSSFPAGFVFGTAASAYQYEGAAREGGRGPSIWDTFAHRHRDKIVDGSNGDLAVDSYHRYKEDVSMIKEMGWDAYRLSISWTRILPNGSLSGGVNKEGIKYYSNLIDDLISNGLQPWVTLFHWDSPQGLEDKYGGFLSYNILQDFRDYADVCFKEFGDRVKHWITINEPFKFCVSGYTTGDQAPGRCSSSEGNCSAGDSGREPYIVCHHLLLAHATAVELYRQKYQENQEGQIGITLIPVWFLPYTDSKSDISAVKRALDFQYGWFMNPLTRGNYPLSMEVLVGDRLPKFSKDQSELVKGSFDFIGINYYTSRYVYSVPPSSSANASYSTDSCTKSTAVRNGAPIRPKAASDWLYVYPPGIREVLLYTKTKYNNPVIYITENGVDELNNKTASVEETLNDYHRIDFHRKHLLYVHRAISEGANVQGYFAWSLLDNFEWSEGYTVRFGINFVDRNNSLKRHPKRSALWFQRLLKS